MLIHEVCHAAVGDNIALDLPLRGHARGFDNCLARVQGPYFEFDSNPEMKEHKGKNETLRNMYFMNRIKHQTPSEAYPSHFITSSLIILTQLL